MLSIVGDDRSNGIERLNPRLPATVIIDPSPVVWVSVWRLSFGGVNADIYVVLKLDDFPSAILLGRVPRRHLTKVRCMRKRGEKCEERNEKDFNFFLHWWMSIPIAGDFIVED